MHAIVKYAGGLAVVDIKDAIDILGKNLPQVKGSIEMLKDAVGIYVDGRVIKSPDNKAVVIMNGDGRVEAVEDDAVRIYIKNYKGDLLVAAVLPGMRIDSVTDGDTAELKLIPCEKTVG